ncbi:MAG: type II toxin-antitoxin system RelE/ParE family toxin [Oscillospiraceae bacterium]|nr:type II toxin-antitoxin system RelE/ParE family toxin [Oscillospiraceae bacterium]
MQKYKVELLAPAWNDLDAISDFHMETVGPKSAKNITDKILTALTRLELFPLSCPLAPYQNLADQGYRILVYGSYLCIYKLLGNAVFVYHIAAGASNYPALFETSEEN